MSEPNGSSCQEVYCASKPAIEAAVQAYTTAAGTLPDAHALAEALIAAHHTNLESARSVCLGDVIRSLEAGYQPQNPHWAHPADYVTKVFRGNGHEGLRL